MTDRALKVLATVLANVAAGLAGLGGAAAAGFQLPWSILAAVLAGTLGWILGSVLAVPLVSWLRPRRYAPSGRPAYRLRELPPTETAAGGKARSLAAMIQAGHPVPAGLVLLPSAFIDDRPSPAVEVWLQRELKAFPADQLFAVRSSALAEDSAAASFAGAYESVLNVPVARLADAIAPRARVPDGRTGPGLRRRHSDGRDRRGGCGHPGHGARPSWPACCSPSTRSPAT